MALDLAKLGSMLSLCYDAKRSEIYGQMGAYNTNIIYFKNDNTFAVRIYAAFHDRGAIKTLTEWSRTQAHFTFVRAWNNRITAMLTPDPSQNEESVMQELLSLYQLAESLGFTPCCSTCGESKPALLYAFTADDLNLCEECSKIVAADVEKSNLLHSAQRPSYLRALIVSLIGGLVTFLFAVWSAYDVHAMWYGALLGVWGLIIGASFYKRSGSTADKTVAAIAISVLLLSGCAGIVGSYAKSFADFNKKTAPEVQYVIDYYEQKQQGYDPYASAVNSGDLDLSSKYVSLSEMTDKELEKTYKNDLRLVEHQTVTSCIKDMRELITSNYGDKVRDSFYSLFIGCIFGTPLVGVFIWWKVIKIDKLRHKLVLLPFNTVNPYEMIVGKQNKE